MTMKIVVINGTLTEREQDKCIRSITQEHPASAIERVVMEVYGEYVDVWYTLNRYRELRKMGGYCIGEPATWNCAKRAEYRETIPNQVEE